MSSEYIAAFDYFDKALTVLSTKSGEVSIIYLPSVTGVPAGIASANLTPELSLTTRIILKITSNKKKRQTKIVVIAKSKLNGMETVISLALIYLEIINE